MGLIFTIIGYYRFHEIIERELKQYGNDKKGVERKRVILSVYTRYVKKRRETLARVERPADNFVSNQR